jgi:hypothetical protein
MRNAISLFLLFGFAAAASPREEYRREFDKTVPLAAGQTFRIENSNGNIVIHAQPRGDAVIRATIRVSADSASEAKSFADQIQIVVQQSGGVSVRTEYPKTWNHHNLGYSVEYDITLPDTAQFDVRNRFGSISVANPHAPGSINNSNGKVSLWGSRGRQQIENQFGEVDVRSNDGDLTVRNTNGSVTAADITGAVDITNRFARVRVTNAGRGVTIRSNNGQIEALSIGGPNLISNSFGPVVVADAKGDVTVEAQNSEINATGVSGAASLRTTFGKVSFSRIGKGVTVRGTNATVTGDTVGENTTVETSFGSVDLRGIKGGARVTSGANSSVRLSGIGGEAYVKTSFGGVTINDVAGPVNVEDQNGSIIVDSRPARQCQAVALHTSFAPIRVTVPSGMGYNVTARTSFGRIRSEPELTVSGEMTPDSLTGKIGGGGCELRLMNQNNSIDILKSVR